MKYLAAALTLLLCMGCARHHKSAAQAAPSRVSQFQTTPLPIPPPVPDPAPVADDVTGAKSDVQAGQSNVQQVLEVAKSNPAAAPVIPTLTSADIHLTAALQKLDDASTRITDLTQKLNDSETAHANTESILKTDIETLKKAAGVDAVTSGKQIQSLEKENDDLRNEDVRQAKSRLFWAGLFCLLGAGGCIAGTFYGFLAGPKLAGCFGIAGIVLIGLSQLLTKIVFMGEVACAVMVAGLIVWLVWEAFHHTPAVVVHST